MTLMTKEQIGFSIVLSSLRLHCFMRGPTKQIHKAVYNRRLESNYYSPQVLIILFPIVVWMHALLY